jgi:hypothetical protein
MTAKTQTNARTVRSRRKGQAALEYIVTYGWGFLAILLVIGVLAYFGLLNPTRYVPARCTFGSQLVCADFRLQSSPGAVQLQFRSNFGDDILIDNVYLFDETVPAGKAVAPLGSFVVKQGNISSQYTFTPADPTPLVTKNRLSVPVIVQFRRNPSGQLHNVTGEVFGTVQ